MVIVLIWEGMPIAKEKEIQYATLQQGIEPWSKFEMLSFMRQWCSNKDTKILHHPIKGSHHGKACPALEELKPFNLQNATMWMLQYQ